ncbi:MAG: YkgJ family cysteine cluster protein [Chlamydiales bacterium]|jgi:Fe-S-cluster containining protein|nr:YkgJ family cysteine cluster protein [Chlamydiales bacterium]
MSEKWYKQGLRFHCTGCGKCCTGSPGYVWVSDREVEEISQFLQISFEECIKKYTRKVERRLSLLENDLSYDCIFLKDKSCQIYSIRPKQCRKFPWWSENLKTKKDWEEEATRCEGINHADAPLISFREIEKQLDS